MASRANSENERHSRRARRRHAATSPVVARSMTRRSRCSMNSLPGVVAAVAFAQPLVVHCMHNSKTPWRPCGLMMGERTRAITGATPATGSLGERATRAFHRAAGASWRQPKAHLGIRARQAQDRGQVCGASLPFSLPHSEQNRPSRDRPHGWASPHVAPPRSAELRPILLLCPTRDHRRRCRPVGTAHSPAIRLHGWRQAGTLELMEACAIRRTKQWVVTLQITCRADESLESACWRWRPLPEGDTLAVQAARDDQVVLRMYVNVWDGQDDAEAAKQAALKKYRLCVAEDDQVEALEAIQTVGHDGFITL